MSFSLYHLCGSIAYTMVDKKPSARRVKLYDTELPKVTRSDWVRLDGRKQPGELSKIEDRFCRLYTTHYEPTRAAIEAGYRPASAHITSRRLLSEPLVKKRIAAIETDRIRRMRFDGDVFLAREMILAQADVTELIEAWIPPCRYCWGINNEYQRTFAEFQEDFNRWLELPDERKSLSSGNKGNTDTLTYDRSGRKIPFNPKGGEGYDPGQPPNPACPNCRGRGNEDPERGTIPYIKLKDTRYLTEVGKILYGGVDSTSKGFKYLIQNQDAARHRLMGMLGKFLELRANSPQQLNGSGLGFQIGLAPSVASALTNDPTSLSDAELDELLRANGVSLDNEGIEGEASGTDTGETPPPGRIA
jgi:phage terminase small subunit